MGRTKPASSWARLEPCPATAGYLGVRLDQRDAADSAVKGADGYER